MSRTIAFMLAVLLWWAWPAHAQSACGQYEKLKSMLAEKYQERRKFVGIGGGMLLEVYVSTAGTFTILVVKPSKFSCIVAAGEDWTEVEPEIISEKKFELAD